MCFCWDLDVSVEVWGWQAYLKSWAQNCTQWKGLRTLLSFSLSLSLYWHLSLSFVIVSFRCVNGVGRLRRAGLASVPGPESHAVTCRRLPPANDLGTSSATSWITSNAWADTCSNTPLGTKVALSGEVARVMSAKSMARKTMSRWQRCAGHWPQWVRKRGKKMKN